MGGVVAVIECLHDAAAGLSKTSIPAVNDADPGILSRVSVDDFAGAIRRAVVNDDPFGRSHTLAAHRLDRGLDEPFLVTNGRDD